MMGGAPPAGAVPGMGGGAFVGGGGPDLTPQEPPAWLKGVDWFFDTPAGKALKGLAMVGSSQPSRIDTALENIQAAGGIGSGRGLLSMAGAAPSIMTFGGLPAFGPGQNVFQPAREEQESTWEKTKRLYGWADFMNENDPTGFFEEHDWTRRIVGFIGDVAFDPITYVTLGSGALANQTSKTIARQLTAASLSAGAKTKTGKMLADASQRVAKSHSKTAAGREALQHLGYDFGLGMSVPGTGRVGRALRLDKALDKLTGGAVTRMRVDQLGHSQRVGTWLNGRFVNTPMPAPGKGAQGTFDHWFEQAVRAGKKGNRMVDDYAEAVAPRVSGPLKDSTTGARHGRVDFEATKKAVRAAREAGEEVDLSMIGRSPEYGHWGDDIVLRTERVVDTKSPVTWIAGRPDDPLASLLDLIDWDATPLGRAPDMAQTGVRAATLGDEPLAQMSRASIQAGGTPADIQSIRRLVASAQKMRVGFQITGKRSDLVATLGAKAVGKYLSVFHKSQLGRWFVETFDRERKITDLMRSADPQVQHLGQSIKQADARGFRWNSEYGSFAETQKRKLVDILNNHDLDPVEVRMAMEEKWRLPDGTLNPNIRADSPGVFNAGEEVHNQLTRLFPNMLDQWEGITGGKIRVDLGNELYVTRVPSEYGHALLELDREILAKATTVPGARGLEDPLAAVTAAGAKDKAVVRGTAGALRARDYRPGSIIWGQQLVEPGQALVYTVRTGADKGTRTVLRSNAPSVTRQMELLGQHGVQIGDIRPPMGSTWQPMFEKSITQVFDSYTAMMSREIHWAGIEEWLKDAGIMLSGDQYAKLGRLQAIKTQVAKLRKEEAAMEGGARQRLHAARRAVSSAEQLTEPLTDTLSSAIGPQYARSRARRLAEAATGSVKVEDMSLDELLGEAAGLRSVIDGLSDEMVSALTAVDNATMAARATRLRTGTRVRRHAEDLITTSAAVVETRQMVAHLKRVANRLTQLEQIGAVERRLGQTFVEGSRVVKQTLRDKSGRVIGHEWATPRGDYIATKERGKWVVRLDSEAVGSAPNLKKADELVRSDLGRLPMDRPAPPTPRPGRGRRPERDLTFRQHRAESEQFIRDRILAPEQAGLAKLSNQARIATLFDELEQSLDYLDEIAAMAPNRLRELGMEDSSVKALQELSAGLRGERLGVDVPASIRSYVDEVNTVRRLEGELDLADLMPYRHEDGIANMKMEASEGGMGEAYWAGKPEEVMSTEKAAAEMERLITETTEDVIAAQSRNPLVSGSPLAGGRGIASEEADMTVDLLSNAVADLEAASGLLARSGQRAAGDVAPFGGRGAGGLFFPRDPDWIPRRAYGKPTPLTTEDVPMGAVPTRKTADPFQGRPRMLDPGAEGTTGAYAARRLSGEAPLTWRDATAFDNVNMAEAALLQARRLRAEARLMEEGVSELTDVQDVLQSLRHRHPYKGGSVSGDEMLFKLFYQGAQEFGPNSYISGAVDPMLAAARRTAGGDELMTTAFRPGSPLGREMTTILGDLVRLSTAGDMNAALRYVSHFVNYVKAASIARPSFFQRNMMGGVFNNYLAGVEMGNTTKFIFMRRAAMKAGWEDTVAAWNKTAEVRGLQPLDDTSWKMFDKRRPIEMKEDAVRRGATKLADSGRGGKSWSKYDMETFADVYDANLIGAGQAGAEVSRSARLGGMVDRKYGGQMFLNPFRSDFVWYDAIRQRNMEIEEILRGSLAYDTLASKGGSLEEAASRVIRYHFNYDRQAQTASEAAIRQHVIPFYVWTRNSVPLMAQEMARQPRKFLTYFRARENLQHGTQGDRNTPEWYGHQAGIRLPIKWKGNQVFAFPDMPFMDVFDLASAATGVGAEGGTPLIDAPLNVAKHFATMVGPQLRVPIEMSLGKQFFADMPISTDPKPLPAVLDIPIIRDALRIFGAKKNSKGQYMIPDNSLYALQNAFPIVGQTRRILPREEGMQDRLGSALTSWLLPMSLRQLSHRERLSAQRQRERRLGIERRTERKLEEGY